MIPTEFSLPVDFYGDSRKDSPQKFQSDEAWGDQSADAEFDGVDGVIAGWVVGDGEHALRFAGGNLQIGGMNTGVKVVGLAFESVLVYRWRFRGRVGLHLCRSGAIVATACAGESCLQRRKKKKGNVRLKVVADGCVHSEDARTAELASSSLIRLGRVGVAVAQNNRTSSERWFYDLGDGLGAVGKHQGHLRERTDGSKCGFGSGIQ